MKEVRKYIRSIRNPLKRSYAESYSAWLADPARGIAPKEPGHLAYMAGQAVRLTLHDLFDHHALYPEVQA